MKLHLPTKLRAAILAFMGAAMAVPTTVKAADGAVYDYTFFQHATQVHANLNENGFEYDDPKNPEERIDDNFDFRDPTSLDPDDNAFDALKNDWTITIDAYNVAPSIDANSEETVGSLILTNSGQNIDNANDSTKLANANSFAIILDRHGSVRLVTSEEANSVKHDIVLFDMDTVWSKEDREDTTVSFRLTLSWDADGGLYRLESSENGEKEKFGALTLQSAYILSNDEQRNVISAVDDMYTGRVLLNNYDLDEDLLSVTKPNEGRTDSGGVYACVNEGATVSVSLQTPGNSPAWCISGDTSIKYLLEGRYKDNIKGSTRKMKTDERVRFIGDQGVIWLTSGEYTYENPTWAGLDPTGKKGNAGVGFGAYEGATITVAESVMNSTVIGTNASISAMGDGTVRLEINTGDILEADLPEVVLPPSEEEEEDSGGIDIELPDSEYDEIVDDDTTLPDTGDSGIAGDGSTSEPGAGSVAPEIEAGTRYLNFNKLGANTKVELDVEGDNTVVVVLGGASIGNNSTSNTTSITRLKKPVEAVPADETGEDVEIVEQQGSLEIIAHDGSHTTRTTYIGTAENKEGNLIINGREVIVELDDEDEIISSEDVFSRLYATNLIATGSISTSAIVRAANQVTAGADVTVEAGSLSTGSLTADGKLSVGYGGNAVAALNVDKKADITGSTNVYGQASFGDLTTDYAVVYNTANPEAYITADSISANFVTRQYVITTVTEEPSETGDDPIQVTTDSYHNIMLARITETAADETAPAPLLSDTVYIGKNGIVAGTIAGNTRITIASESTSGVTATNINGSELVIGNTTVITNLVHSGGAAMFIPNAGKGHFTSTGKLSADTFTLPDGYTLNSSDLTIKEGLNAKVVMTSGETHAKDIVVDSKSVTFSKLQTGLLELKDNIAVVGAEIETTEGAYAGNNVTLAGALIKGNMSTGENARISNVTTEGILTTGQNARLENVTFKNTYKSTGYTELKNISVGDVTFGGTNGDAFSIGTKCEKLVFSGTLNDSETGVTLAIDNMAVDISNLTFGADETSYDLMLASEGNSYTLNPKDIAIYAPSYTYADITTDGSTISITGRFDEAAAKQELTDTEQRATSMAALEYAMATTNDPVVNELHDMLGRVINTTLEQRHELLDAISGASITALADSQRRGVQDVQSSLRNRIIQMGGAYDSESSGLQAWAQADGSFSSTDGGDDAPGYDYNTWGATVGANFDLTENLVVGMSFSASYGEIDVDGPDRATGNNDAYYVNLFARHQSERWMQMLIITAGMNDMDLERNVASYTGSGTTEGTSISAYYELGYTLGLNEEFTHILQPLVSASITSAKIDGYTESGTIGGAALEYDGDSLVYGTVGIGFRYQGVLSQSVHERNTVLEIRALLTQDFGDTTDEAKVAMAGGEMFSVSGTDTTGTGYTLGAGLTIPVEVQTTIFADVDMTIRPDFTGIRANVGMRYDF